ncbi:hypothetical protein [Novipirellula artificiosorum]|uniref:Uncharacterized protein n=1 Tax=Novipirellula artificiosorum TaxID=2528016 RepID=A0A5C6DV57_9BACT|nr:hypothetical protein [Novipirellula artificiosorum]TWU40498.1 hypothetical protein Poly41_13310 [Novipirellula artificiosorum]
MFRVALRPLAVWVSFCGAAVLFGSTALAQSDDADDPTASPKVTLSIAPGGTQRNVAGRWATASVGGFNRSDVDATETAVVMLGDDGQQQYARRIWIPPHATRRSWLPIKIPRGLPLGQVQLDMSSIHVKNGDRGESYQSNVVGMPVSERSLLLSWEPSRTAVILDSSDLREADPEHRGLLIDTIYTARDWQGSSGQDLGLVHLNERFLPPGARTFDPIDQIVIANDRLLEDSVGVARLQSWLHGGGRVWIMIDQVDAESVSALLGTAPCYSVVDRVELSDFEVRLPDVYGLSGNLGNEAWSSETPVELLRVFAESDDVACTIDGWPAAFWKRFGRGEVLFTALGARGWVKEGKSTGAMQAISSRFFVRRLESPTYSKLLSPLLEDQIGYKIPGRNVVAVVLGGHLAVVALIGFWLWRRQSSQHLAWIIPCAAIVAGGALFAIGKQHTSSVAATIATGQIAQVVPESSQVQVHAVSALYSDNTRSLGITSSATTTAGFVHRESSGELSRIVWDDSGAAQWLDLTQPPGIVRHVESDSIITVQEPWSFRGRFNSKGFQGSIEGLADHRCQDAVIVAAGSPSLAVHLDDPSKVTTSEPGDTLPPNQFLSDSMLSDTQQVRQQLMRQLMGAGSPLVGRDPTLVVWTDPVESGLAIDGDYARTGSAMALLPVCIERTAVGERFSVPATFVRLEPWNRSSGVSSFFDAERGQWPSQINRPLDIAITCIPPSELQPCQLERAIVTIKVNAPSRNLEVRGRVGERFVSLESIKNPSGVLRFEITDREALRLDADGGMPLMISVQQTDQERAAMDALEDAGNRGDTYRPDSVNQDTWQIDYVHVSLEGIRR